MVRTENLYKPINCKAQSDEVRKSHNLILQSEEPVYNKFESELNFTSTILFL